MRFWDSSAIVPLLLREAATERVLALSRERMPITVWWGTPVECDSAIARRIREGRPDSLSIGHAREELGRLESMWTEVAPTEALRQEARRLLRVHALRAADAFQLAAALIAADGSSTTLPFVCLDERLCEAAQREGFPVKP